MSRIEPLDSEETAPRATAAGPVAMGGTVAGKYKVLRLIARGGMSTVYLAEQLPLGRSVALKVVTPPPEDEGEGEDFGKRFRLEAETLASLHHPNIVVLHDYGQDEVGRYFLVMEYVEGPRFLDLLSEGPMDPDRVIRLVQQVLAALKHAHARGVVHRDLKPSNILVECDAAGNENVRVVDFGLVKVMEGDQSFTRAGLVLGSPHFMSPEQCRGTDVDHRTDIYAVGVLMFRALTGIWPFHGNNPTATMLSHLHDPLRSLGQVAPGRPFPAGLDTAVRRCLARSPEDRWGDVSQLSAALSEIAAGRGEDESSSLVMQPARPVWLVPAAVVVALGVLVGTLTLAFWLSTPPRPALSPPAPTPTPSSADAAVSPPPGTGDPTAPPAPDAGSTTAGEPGIDANSGLPAGPSTSTPPPKATPKGEKAPPKTPKGGEPAKGAAPAKAPDAPPEKKPEAKAPDGYMPLPDDMK